MEQRDLTRQEGQTFLAHVIQRELPSLIDFAHIIHGAGGPMNAIDGSAEGLTRFYPWMRDWWISGAPGIDIRVAPSVTTAFRSSTDLDPAGLLVAQLLEHLYKLVITANHPVARWVLYRNEKIPMAGQNQIAIDWGGSTLFNTSLRCQITIENIGRGGTSALAAGRLVELLNLTGVPIRRDGIGRSLLRPYLDMARPDWDDPRRQVPVFAEHKPEQIGYQGPTRSKVVLADQDADFVRLERSLPVDASRLCEVLLAFDATTLRGKPLEVGHLRRRGTLSLLDGTSTADVIVSRGELKGLLINPAVASEANWEMLRQALSNFAAENGYRLVDEDTV